jgi:putative transposase
MMEAHPTSQRRSPRLQGFDYSEPGEYFVTVCAAQRACLFGTISAGGLTLSLIGKIVDRCWRSIPEHFPHVRACVHQVMPNHLHGIIQIMDRVGTRHAVSLHPSFSGVFGHPKPGCLSTIIGSFKSASTRTAHELQALGGRRLWQSRFYDHIIRDDYEYHMIERYICLNPSMWYLDTMNPHVMECNPEQARTELRQVCGDESTVEWILNHEFR